jgi:hypothetical protein
VAAVAAPGPPQAALCDSDRRTSSHTALLDARSPGPDGDRLDDSGVVTVRYHDRLHDIGLGRTHARTHVLLLIQNLNIRVIK